MNDSLHPLPRASEPSDAVSSASASSSDSSDSYNGDDAQRFLHEWRMAHNRYVKVTWENGQLEIRLGVSQATLHVAKEEASAVRARLAGSDTTVVGKMSPMNASILVSTIFILIVLLFSMIASPDGAVRVSPTSGECGHGRRQCLWSPHQCSPPRHLGPCLGDRPPWCLSWRIGGANCSASPDKV